MSKLVYCPQITASYQWLVPFDISNAKFDAQITINLSLKMLKRLFRLDKQWKKKWNWKFLIILIWFWTFLFDKIGFFFSKFYYQCRCWQQSTLVQTHDKKLVFILFVSVRIGLWSSVISEYLKNWRFSRKNSRCYYWLLPSKTIRFFGWVPFKCSSWVASILTKFGNLKRYSELPRATDLVFLVS